MAVRRITRRWLFNSFGVILLILAAIIVAFSLGMRSFYYNSVRQAIDSRANTITAQLSKSAQEDASSYSREIRNIVEAFSDRNLMELMAIAPSGKVLITSSGFEPSEDLYMPDFVEVISSEALTAERFGSMNGENVLAVSFAAPAGQTGELAAIRFVVSLTDVDRQIVLMIALITLVGVAILLFVIFSSSYFINSIVIPLGEVGNTARKIAQGNFDTRLTHKNDDEIGELCDIINHMADELASSEKLKNDFISSVSHELRTPLTAIKGWGETLLSTGASDPETMEKGMKVILSETERLSTMVEELLDFSRMQSGRISLMLTRLDLVAEVGDAVLMFTQRARREGVQLLFEEPELAIPVKGDKNRLKQVFVNIIDNALKYSEEGGQIFIGIEQIQSTAVVSVQDTGCGIRAEDLPKVKAKFYKGASARRGSGIGLAVADEIIKLHGGTLELKSKVGEGTQVIVRLPVAGRRSDDFAERVLPVPSSQ